MDLIETFPASNFEAIYDGYVKVKLAHARGFSLILPDVLVVDLGGCKWFAPRYFSACLLSFLGDGAYAQFNIEPKQDVKLLIGITKDRLVRRFPDGSFLYRCRIGGPAGLAKVASGTCTLTSDHTMLLDLFHHTSDASAAAILDSQHFRGSRWNIQGTKQLANVEYAYFTSLPKIVTPEDLELIAMASSGQIFLLPTNGMPPNDVIAIKVYRENTANRRNAIGVRVPADLIAPYHVWRHEARDQPYYYEVCHPEILRVGLEPGTVLRFNDGTIDRNTARLKRFDYTVLGYADTPPGLVAPYDEEETHELFKIEHCDMEGDLFGYWQQHPNDDHYTGRRVELQSFKSNS